MSLTVELSPKETLLGAMIGVFKVATAQQLGRHQRHGLTDLSNRFQNDIDGALAEMALARALDVYWLPGNTPDHDGDVGREQVRATSRAGGCLIAHPDDEDDLRFHLVIVKHPTYYLVGWAYGHECKRPEFWRDDERVRPAFFVPQAALHDYAEIGVAV